MDGRCAVVQIGRSVVHNDLIPHRFRIGFGFRLLGFRPPGGQGQVARHLGAVLAEHKLLRAVVPAAELIAVGFQDAVARDGLAVLDGQGVRGVVVGGDKDDSVFVDRPLGRQGHIARRHLETPLAVVALLRGHIFGLDRPSRKGVAFLGRLVNRHFLVVIMTLGTAVHRQRIAALGPFCRQGQITRHFGLVKDELLRAVVPAAENRTLFARGNRCIVDCNGAIIVRGDALHFILAVHKFHRVAVDLPLGGQGHIARRHLEAPLAVAALFRGHIFGLDRPSCKGITFLGRLVNRHFLVVIMEAPVFAVHGQLVGNRTPLGFQRHAAGNRRSVITKNELLFNAVLRVVPAVEVISGFAQRRAVNRFAVFHIDIFRCRAMAVGVKFDGTKIRNRNLRRICSGRVKLQVFPLLFCATVLYVFGYFALSKNIICKALYTGRNCYRLQSITVHKRFFADRCDSLWDFDTR